MTTITRSTSSALLSAVGKNQRLVAAQLVMRPGQIAVWVAILETVH